MTTKLVATGAFLAFLASASIALAEDKVTLCHVTESDSNPFVLITVSSNAVPAHVSHGDFIAPGETVENCDDSGGGPGPN
ncbi:hypothetical protein A2851_05650 [Candidatus Kaiserbacteria bacterium RIFCSPHIGHO2_01_FULL_53_29]|uniref:Uncharacterized protein n=1 Tax=Candidatus Kaiserbacteria bacterium RIFCSPHIGHO2_01_FULL_53_29 TaxID=1798480 RepID=A0A1F6CWE2_9BACT|nr:MAG: hypothetical protein A2851_05650 [Candidatus Kaiserbacteria bacterium RIFCSPHIGHO2_01_FULL_53_29]